MNRDSVDIADNNSSYNRDIGIVVSILESGHSVELPATGYSMFPTFRPGDLVVVKPLLKGEIPEKGCVVVYLDYDLTNDRHNGKLVMHRLVKIMNDEAGNHIFISRGDSMREPDRQLSQHQLLGVAYSYKRSKKEFIVKAFVPGVCRYKNNRRLFWLYSKIKRLF